MRGEEKKSQRVARPSKQPDWLTFRSNPPTLFHQGSERRDTRSRSHHDEGWCTTRQAKDA